MKDREALTFKQAWRRWLIVGAVLLATHGITAYYYAKRYSHQRVQLNGAPLTLRMTPDEWAAHMPWADSAAYVLAAESVAAGRGLVVEVPGISPPRSEPFATWAPGTPWVLGQWLKLFGNGTMRPLFYFVVVAQLLFGIIAVATASLWIRGTAALAAVAAATGCCPPLQQAFYGTDLTSSEIVSLPVLALALFALARGFILYRAAEENWRGLTRQWRVGLWFALAGLLIGLQSLIRDSGAVFAEFVALFLVGRALLADRRRLALAAASAAMLAGATAGVRYPIQLWNQQRIGAAVVSTSTPACVWRYGLWFKHDECDWFLKTGLGFGEYLDPTAPARVEAYYQSGKPRPELYSLGQLVQAVWRRPVDALAFKAAGLPMLWLGTERWPNVHFKLVAWWSTAFYLMLLTYCVVQRRRRKPIPEVVYLYLLLILCVSPVIHAEFRYTFPVWNTLVMLPGLLIGTLVDARQARQAADSHARSVSGENERLPAAKQPVIAA